MDKLIIGIGGLLGAYTVVAMMIGLPQLCDLIPVGSFTQDDGKFYKIVLSDKQSYGNYYVIGFGIFLIAIGLLINKIKARN